MSRMGIEARANENSVQMGALAECACVVGLFAFFGIPFLCLGIFA